MELGRVGSTFACEGDDGTRTMELETQSRNTPMDLCLTVPCWMQRKSGEGGGGSGRRQGCGS